MRRAALILIIECYALLLAALQALGGVRTDEAKYLLDIPYPHPPLVRSLLALTSALPYQEMLWRIVFATLLAQGVWLVWSMTRKLSEEARFAVAAAWLLNAAVVLQGGSLMMAPLTALQGLAFVAILFASRRSAAPWAGWKIFGIGVLWLASLLTAYQAALYLPIVAAVFARLKIPYWQWTVYVFGPVAAALLFSVAEPLILASFLNAGTQNTSLTLIEKGVRLFQAWSIAGSIIFSIIGLAGLALERERALLASFVLVCLFLFVSFRLYYAILFTPLLIAGTVTFIGRAWQRPIPLLLPLCLITLLCLLLFPPVIQPSSARATMRRIASETRAQTVLIAGSFGHEWQFESPGPVLRYHPSLLGRAQAAVCLNECDGIAAVRGWEKLENAPVEVWVKR